MKKSKKILSILFLFIIGITIFYVGHANAEDKYDLVGIEIRFFARGKQVASGNVVIDSDFVTNKDDLLDYVVSYKKDETINNINNLNGEIFTLKDLTEGAEWYGFNKSYDRIYFSQSETYTAKQIAKLLGVTKCTSSTCTEDGIFKIILRANGTDEVMDEDNVNNTLEIISGEDHLFGKTRTRMIIGATFTLGVDENTLAENYEAAEDSACTVNAKGKVKAKRRGVCSIKATYNGEELTYTGNVYKLYLDVNTLSLDKNETKNIVLGFIDVNDNVDDHPIGKYSNLEVTYEFSDESKANSKDVDINVALGTKKVAGKVEVSAKDVAMENAQLIFKVNGIKGTTLNIEVKDDDNLFFDIKFLNTSSSRGSNSMIINAGKKDGEFHYIMLDTALANGTFTCDQLIKDAKDYMIPNSKGKYVLDYLIISHDHSDHNGCLSAITDSSSGITVKNIVMKKGKNSKSYEKVTKKSINIIDSTDFGTQNNKSRDMKIANVNLKIFNATDQYKKVDCSEKTEVVLWYEPKNSLTESLNNGKMIFVKDVNKKIYAIKASEPNKIITITKKEYNQYIKDTDNGKNRTADQLMWVAIQKVNLVKQKDGTTKKEPIRHSICNANANSLALLLEIKMGKDYKYIYLPGDLQNNGYPFAELNSETEGITTFLSKTKDKDGNVVKTILKTENKVANTREDTVANQVKNYIKNNGHKLTDIVIYQEAHHGYNNSSNAMTALGFTNNSNLYVVGLSNTKDDEKNANKQRTYFYTLNTIKKSNYLYSGGAGAIEFRIEKVDKKYSTRLITNYINESITL